MHLPKETSVPRYQVVNLHRYMSFHIPVFTKCECLIIYTCMMKCNTKADNYKAQRRIWQIHSLLLKLMGK